MKGCGSAWFLSERVMWQLRTDGGVMSNAITIIIAITITMIITITIHHHHAVRGTTNEGAVTEDASRPAHAGRSASCLPIDPDEQASGN